MSAKVYMLESNFGERRYRPTGAFWHEKERAVAMRDARNIGAAASGAPDRYRLRIFHPGALVEPKKPNKGRR